MLRSVVLGCAAALVCSFAAANPVLMALELLEKNDAPAKVSVELYFEALCPYCHQIITGPLMEAAAAGLDEIMTLKLIPYGNAKETPELRIAGGYTYQCQHGPAECDANRMLACALDISTDAFAALPFVACMAHADASPERDARECAFKTGLDYTQLMHCYDNHQGWKLMHQNAVDTGRLVPAHTYVPWLVVNGQHTEDSQAAAQADLIGYVCQLYSGTDKPAGCPRPKYTLKGWGYDN